MYFKNCGSFTFPSAVLWHLKCFSFLWWTTTIANSDLWGVQKDGGVQQQLFHLDCGNASKLTNTTEISTLDYKMLKTILRWLAELVQPFYW